MIAPCTLHLLVAEDDPAIRTGLVDLLESEGYAVSAAGDGNQALDLFHHQTFDLILLDIMMPGQSGYDVCRQIRSRNDSVPIIMLTAKSEEIDKVVGLQLGADDYITKPFGVHELLARVAAVLRRVKRAPATNQVPAKSLNSEPPAPFNFGAAEIDPRQYRARCGARIQDLSARELELLIYFHAHPDQVLSRDRILNAVWGVGYFGTTRTLDQHVARLRKKIEPDPAHPRYLTTVHGVGYRYQQT